MTNYLPRGDGQQAAPDGVRQLYYAQRDPARAGDYLELLEVTTPSGLVRLLQEHGLQGYRWRVLSNLCDGQTFAELSALFAQARRTKSAEGFTAWGNQPYWESPADHRRQGQTAARLQTLVRAAVRSQLALWDALRAIEQELAYEDDAEQISEEIACFCATCAAVEQISPPVWDQLAAQVRTIAQAQPAEA